MSMAKDTARKRGGKREALGTRLHLSGFGRAGGSGTKISRFAKKKLLNYRLLAK